MEALFLITLLGCSHDLNVCETVEQVEVAVVSESECVQKAQDLVMETPVNFPVSAFDCARLSPPGNTPEPAPIPNVNVASTD